MEEKDKQPDPQLVEDIEYLFIERRRTLNPNYQLMKTRAFDENVRKAALLCEELGANPAELVLAAFDGLGNNKKFFGPQHLCGAAVKRRLMEKNVVRDEGDLLNIEITNATMDYEMLWDAQMRLVKMYMKHGHTPDSILNNSSVKLFAWFRILSTDRANPEIIERYGKAAAKEIKGNRNLLAFLKRKNLNIERISQ